MTRRRICIVTGSRAEYGLLRGLIKDLQSHSNTVELQLVVTGMHLSKLFGETYKEIEHDGFQIHERVDIDLIADDPVSISRSMGLCIARFGECFAKIQPDIIVVLGDRYEILGACIAALLSQIPIAHIHGGETTEGLIDEAIRHSITKMAHLHFVAAEPYKDRVIQLGENYQYVYNFGSPALDQIRETAFLEKSELEKSLNFTFDDCTILITYHPVTLAKRSAHESMKQLLAALDNFPKAKLIFTKSNADAGGLEINKLIDDYVSINKNRAVAFTSLGQKRYLSALKYVNIVVGNSSSGLIEVPFFHKPTVNIGERQKGRLRAPSVIDCPEETSAIELAIKKALTEDFQKIVNEGISPYGDISISVSQKISETLRTTNLKNILMKKFFDFKPGIITE